MRSTILVPFTASDGENLALYAWPLEDWAEEMGPDAPPPRGVVLIVHGLGEHSSRYTHVAHALMSWGFSVRAYDQRGHGESSGPRGVLPSDTTLLDDLTEIVDDTRMRCLRLPYRLAAQGADGTPAPLPLILLGHSLGGLVVSRFVTLNIRSVEGLVLSSPALDVGLGAFKKVLLAASRRLTPNWSQHSRLDARYISHDARIVEDYRSDRLVHSRISPRLGYFIASGGPATVAAAAQWKTPTLLMYAGADRLVNPLGSQKFAQTAADSAAVKPGTVTAKCFEGLYHEIFNEVASEPVFETLRDWLEDRF